MRHAGNASKRACRWLRLPLLLLLVAITAPAFAQLASGPDPETVADAAVQAWLEQEPIGVGALSTMSTEEICQALPSLVTNPPPPPGTRVNFDDRRELTAADPNGGTATGGGEVRRYSYSAARANGQLEVVEVTVERQGDTWVATSVGFRVARGSGPRAWLQTPIAQWVFVAFTALVVYLLLTPGSVLRRWLNGGRQAIAEHRGVVLFTMVLLWGMFALGAFFGSQLPDSCTDSVLTVVETAVASVGATDAYDSGNVARAAAVTFYQNFIVVTVSLTFSLALLFGVPAYLVTALSFFVQAIPFGLIGAFSGPQVTFVLVLLLLELSAYFLVVAGGGMFLVTLVRRGFGALSEAFTKLALMLPIAMLLLLIGAWYEAVIVILLRPGP